jgi:thymidylate synthase
MYKRMYGVETFVVGNVAEALYLAKQSLDNVGELVKTRVGMAKEFKTPVAITYNHPQERVIFYEERDANPIFHFMESLWMLNGMRDLETVQYYNKRMRDFSDDDKTLQGAYGYRWRKHFGYDQLKIIIERLTSYKNDRRAVLSMWDAKQDLSHRNESKDLPCNTHVYFSIREGFLDMTVCNRSNDLIWGCCGANAVHMSFLQEYVATMCGVEMGFYTQFTHNLHAYLDTLKTLDGMQPDYDSYAVRQIEYQTPLVTHPKVFDEELKLFMLNPIGKEFKNKIFSEVAIPMFRLWVGWKSKSLLQCAEAVGEIKSDDWRLACNEWIRRREDKLS